MDTLKRATVYFDSELHQALRLKSVVMGRSISEIVNLAVSQSLSDDADDIEAHNKRRQEKSLDFDTIVKNLKRRGKI